MTDNTDGVYIGRTEKNNIRLTALKNDESLVFHLSPERTQEFISTLQSELSKAQNGGSE